MARGHLGAVAQIMWSTLRRTRLQPTAVQVRRLLARHVILKRHNEASCPLAFRQWPP